MHTPCLPIATLTLGQVEESEPGLPPAERMNKSKEHNVPLGRARRPGTVGKALLLTVHSSPLLHSAYTNQPSVLLVRLCVKNWPVCVDH